MARSPEPEPSKPLRLPALLQRAAEPLFVLSRQRRLLFVNEAWQKLTGISLREARGLLCKRYRTVEAGSRETLLHALHPPAEVLAGRPSQCRRQVLVAGGQIASWEISFFPLPGPDGLLGILGRITPGPVESVVTPLPARFASLRDRLGQWHQLDHLDGETPALHRAYQQAQLAANTLAPVLLLGEPGTGKQWTARALHQRSTVGSRAFVALDCQRLPALVIEALLFGSGGLVHRPGVGTLYLREPQFLPRELQARLIEVAAVLPGEGEGRRPGPRLLAGCAADPAIEVGQGRLLEELHCALGVLTVSLPPLRLRRAEFPILVRRLLARLADRSQAPTELTADAWEVLRAWPWPGNLRELDAVLHSACRRAKGEKIEVEELPWYLRGAPPPPPRSLPLRTLLQEVERRLITLALQASEHNKTKAARLLGVWRALLVRRIKELGIEEKD
jgi:transcriptional regulator with PAS, ATPase and Fis domain